MIDAVPRPRPPYLNREVTRHGRVVWFVRVYPGPRIRIRGKYGTPEFKAAYEAAIAGKPAPDAGESFPAQTIGWLIEQYRCSSAWGQLRPATRRQRDCILRSVLDTAGQQRIGRIDKAAIERGLDRRPNPYAQRHFLQTMRGLFKWAAAAKHIVSDPTSSVKTIRPRTDGHATWPQEWCDRFEARWALGTRQRLAYDVFLYTGLRIGDAVRLGRPHTKNGIATIRTEKNGEIITIPILPPLQASIDAGPIGELTFIAGERGKPLTKEACANWFRHACRAAGVPGSPHGLRKTAATRAADNGATEAELEALFGWRGGDMASLYTRAANRARLAKRAANKLLVGNIMRISIPAPSQKVRGAEEKKK